MRKISRTGAMLGRTAFPIAAAVVAMTAGATAANAAVYLGADLRDSVPVSAAEFVPGAIVFDLYLLTPSAPTCTDANHVFTNTKLVSGPGTITSDPYRAVNTGVYQWVASYYTHTYQLIARGACPDPTEQTEVVPHGITTVPEDSRPGPLQPPPPPPCQCPPATQSAGAAPKAPAKATEPAKAPAPAPAPPKN